MGEDVEWRESSNRRCLAGRGLAKLTDLRQICSYDGSYEAPRICKKLCYDIKWEVLHIDNDGERVGELEQRLRRGSHLDQMVLGLKVFVKLPEKQILTIC